MFRHLSNRFGHHVLFFGALGGVLVVDQLSKMWVVVNLPPYQPTDLFSWLTPFLSLTSVRNTGVAFGLFPQLGDLFLVFSLMVVVGVLAFRHILPPDNLWVQFSLGLVVGGALGNVVDRLLRGYVIDFLDVNFWPLSSWPVFNLADASIVVGVAILLLDSFLAERREAMVDA